MKKILLTAVSALAITVSTPAAAEMENTKAQNKTQGELNVVTETEIEQGWNETKKTVSNAAENVSESVSETYTEFRQALSQNDDESEMQNIQINMRRTAEGIIGEPIYNMNGERVAKIHDIIIDRDGTAQMLVVADGDFTGLGKLVAFNYGDVTTHDSNGDMMTQLNEEMIDNAVTFSYDSNTQGEGLVVMPSGTFSLARILDGELVNPAGDTLAEIDNIVLRNGVASNVIVGYGSILGFGGEQAVISLDDADMMPNDDSIDLKLSAEETADFRAFKKTAMQ